MTEGNVRLEWDRGQASPDDACVSVYARQFIVNVEEDEMPKFTQEANEVCRLLNAQFAGKFNQALYDLRDAEIAKMRCDE